MWLLSVIVKNHLPALYSLFKLFPFRLLLFESHCWQSFSVFIKHYWDIFQFNLLRCKVTALAIFSSFSQQKRSLIISTFLRKSDCSYLSLQQKWVGWLAFKTLIIIRQNFSRVRSPLLGISMWLQGRWAFSRHVTYPQSSMLNYRREFNTGNHILKQIMSMNKLLCPAVIFLLQCLISIDR